jgi:hypothetical protein
MDVAKRYAVTDGERSSVADALLSRAASLDYALLLSSEHGNEPLEAADAVAATIRDTMTQAVSAALDFARSMNAAPRDAFEDFAQRYLRPGGIFETLRCLRENDVVISSDIVFAELTVASDLFERREREGRR